MKESGFLFEISKKFQHNIEYDKSSMAETITEPTLSGQRKLCNIWIELFPIDQGVTSDCVFETV